MLQSIQTVIQLKREVVEEGNSLVNTRCDTNLGVLVAIVKNLQGMQLAIQISDVSVSSSIFPRIQLGRYVTINKK